MTRVWAVLMTVAIAAAQQQDNVTFKSNTQLVTLHSVLLTNLQPHALYHYRARSAAENYRPVISRDFVICTREGGANLLKAATASGASRLVVESVAFAVNGDAAQAVEELEQATRGFARAALILRFGRLWGPGTSYEMPPQPPTIHIEKAGAEAARLLTHAPPATYIVTASQ